MITKHTKLSNKCGAWQGVTWMEGRCRLKAELGRGVAQLGGTAVTLNCSGGETAPARPALLAARAVLVLALTLAALTVAASLALTCRTALALPHQAAPALLTYRPALVSAPAQL